MLKKKIAQELLMLGPVPHSAACLAVAPGVGSFVSITSCAVSGEGR